MISFWRHLIGLNVKYFFPNFINNFHKAKFIKGPPIVICYCKEIRLYTKAWKLTKSKHNATKSYWSFIKTIGSWSQSANLSLFNFLHGWMKMFSQCTCLYLCMLRFYIQCHSSQLSLAGHRLTSRICQAPSGRKQCWQDKLHRLAAS